jgi:hypothetical protein
MFRLKAPATVTSAEFQHTPQRITKEAAADWEEAVAEDNLGSRGSLLAAGGTQFAVAGKDTSRRQRVAVDRVTEEGHKGCSPSASEHKPLGKEQPQGVHMEWACLDVAWGRASEGLLPEAEPTSEVSAPCGVLECWEWEHRPCLGWRSDPSAARLSLSCEQSKSQ